MALTKDDVKHIAKLARLEMGDAEIEKFQGQLSGILDHAKMLEEIDTTNVEPIAQITGLRNVSFEDKVKDCDVKEALLEQSPMDKQDGMIKVKNVF